MEVNPGKVLVGHQRRSFDIRLWFPQDPASQTQDSALCLTASEDGTAKLWNVGSGKSEYTFKHSKTSEVLRATFIKGARVICCCGADGKAAVWSEVAGAPSRRKYEIVCQLDHGEGQIYVCEKLGGDNFETAVDKGGALSGAILTGADDKLYLWDLAKNAAAEPNCWSFQSLESYKKEHQSQSQAGVEKATSFGGPRNDENMAFIFDAKPSSTDPWRIAVALSDGSVRIINVATTPTSARMPPVDKEGSCQCINIGELLCNRKGSSVDGGRGDERNLVPPHSTGVCWSPDDSLLVVCLGDGSAAVIDLASLERPTLRTLIKAHRSSCYGARFLPFPQYERSGKAKGRRTESRKVCATWSSDGSLAMWDLSDCTSEDVTDPILRHDMKKYPVYACDVLQQVRPEAPDEPSELTIALAGGGGESTFLGIPVHIINLVQNL